MSSNATLTACYTSSELSADEVDHPEWKRAQPIHITRYWSNANAPTSRHAEARVLWSDESLVVRFVCRQGEPLIINARPETKLKTIGLWEKDVCEIFIAPDPNELNRYFEFEGAPTGEWVDLAIHPKHGGRETDWAFNSGMSAGARVGDNEIVIVMRIPWSEHIQKPRKGSRWRVNLFRCVGSGEKRGYLAWQPTCTKTPDFHVPAAFGWMIFE